MNEETKSEDMDRIQEHLNALGEYFDSVHIFATRHEPAILNGTISVNLGIGNWHARSGQVREWIISMDEHTRISARKDCE